MDIGELKKIVHYTYGINYDHNIDNIIGNLNNHFNVSNCIYIYYVHFKQFISNLRYKIHTRLKSIYNFDLHKYSYIT